MHRLFARMIDAFRPADGPPPRKLLAFFRWCLSGAWPGLIDKLAVLVGISYPPALLLLLASIVLLVKSLHSDMVNTRIERDVRRLNQRLALLEADLNLPAHPRPDQDSL